MSRGTPLLAMLGMLAVAGYQNREKIAEMLGGLAQPKPGEPQQPGSKPGDAQQKGLGGLFDQLSSSLGAGGAGGFLSSALNELVERFNQSGQAEAAESWVGNGPNKPCPPSELERAIGPDVLDTLAKQTGLSRDELVARLSRELPAAVDKYTPQGQLPTGA